MPPSIRHLDTYHYHGSVVLGFQVALDGRSVVTIGCSIRTRQGRVLDRPPRKLNASGCILCAITAPSDCLVDPSDPRAGWEGDVMFALWEDDSFRARHGDTGWIPWSAPWLVGSSTAGLDLQEARIAAAYSKRVADWSF